MSWTSDFAKPYLQVLQLPNRVRTTIVAQLHPEKKRVVYVILRAHLFWGTTPLTRFSQNRAWFIFALSAFYAIPTYHCVEDMFGVECNATIRRTRIRIHPGAVLKSACC